MADKKKKVSVFKAPITPKRPIILKSDREPPKEVQKEKVDKEKQPTILLKVREPSVPKDDRPQSPKDHGTESEFAHSSKISQHEIKEKKNIEHKLCQPIPPMLEPVKLLDENLEFNSNAVEFLHDSSVNYLVVGIIGLQGVGKSTILNLIAHDKPMDDICSHILTSHELPEKNVEEYGMAQLEDQIESFHFNENDNEKAQNANEGYFKFKMQDIEQIEHGLHCTKGIDMYVTNDRVILLDCQPLWSPSLLDENTSTNAVTGTARSANAVTVDSLQLASYLMAICHVLIVVQDWFTDYNFLRYIQTAEMLKPTLSASNAASTSQDGTEATTVGETHPHLLFLHNHCELEDFTPEIVKNMQDVYKNVFITSKLQFKTGMYLYSDTTKNGLNIDAVCKTYNKENCGKPINLFLLPEIYDDYDNKEIYRGHPSFEKLAERLRWMVMGANRHQITNVPNLSEKGWFHYANKAWESIGKCTFFMEYERLLP